MKFHHDGPSIPDILLDRCDAGRVVFLCGAGVSLPSGMPSFTGLTQHVIEAFDPPLDSEVMKAFQPWLDDPTGVNMPLDQIFNLLHLEYGKDEVNSLVTERLMAPAQSEEVGHHHDLIRRISSNASGTPQIVTTNFDLLFERGETVPCHVPPAFPDLAFGTSIGGITYLHGRLAEAGAAHHPYVLSSADFGRAYLSEAWATNFIRNLLERYTVVLVGYQAEDPPIKYLLQGLNHDGQYDRSRLYAFDKGEPEDIEAKWRDRGATAIAYANHPKLWETMEAWANRADDSRAWRSSIVSRTQRNPRDLAAYERGQVAHVLRTVQGAKLFGNAEIPAHPEWICVLDANVRSAKRYLGYGDNAETFDPRAAYGLDDDRINISDEDYRRGLNNDNLLAWHDGDENPSHAHRIGGRQTEGSEATPPRLFHLMKWIEKSLHSPVLAWWAIRQNGLHPRLLQMIEWQAERDENLHDRARHVWNLILEYHNDQRNRRWDRDWFDLKKRIATEGWSDSVLRDFRRAADPGIVIEQPFSLAGSMPPVEDWDVISLRDLGQFKVKFFERHDEELNVPDNAVAEFFGILQGQFFVASGMLADMETRYFTTPTCYPGREMDGREGSSKATKAHKLFLNVFSRLAASSPEVARGYVMTWPWGDEFFFRKLKLYALAKANLFNPHEVVDALLALDQEVFWDNRVVRELIFLLFDRWSEFTEAQQSQLFDRILSGPDQSPHWSDEEYPGIKRESSARYARYLELSGCTLSFAQSDRLSIMISRIPNWNDGWATSTITQRGSHSGYVVTNDAPDVLLELPVNEVVERAAADLGRDFGSLTERRPFTGLVRTNPRKALAALTDAARHGDYPPAFWTALITDMPDDASPRLRTVVLHRLLKLPLPIVDELRHALARWLESGLKEIIAFDQNLGWSLFDHVVDGVVSGGAPALESSLGEVRRGGEVIASSRRTYDHAINGPLGMCAGALFDAAPGGQQDAGSKVPDHIKNRLERLLAAPGEGSDHAVSITMSQINWIMHLDPDWAKERLIPMLAFEHPAAEPAWNGFLHSNRVPTPGMAEASKPLLLELFPWIEEHSWSESLTEVGAQWLGYLNIFERDELYGITNREMRSTLRAMSDAARNHFVFWLGKVGEGNDSGWTNIVAPFLQDVWPRERRYRTASSVTSWIRLLDDTGDDFPVVYDAVKRFLVPVENDDHPFYRFTRDADDEDPLTSKFPEPTLDLLNRVTPRFLTRAPYELPRILALIAEAEPGLTSDHRYLRLIDLVERS